MYEGGSSNCVYIMLYTKLLQLPRSCWTAVGSGRQYHDTSKYLHFFIPHASEGSDFSTQSICKLLPRLVTADIQVEMRSSAHAVMPIMIESGILTLDTAAVMSGRHCLQPVMARLCNRPQQCHS